MVERIRALCKENGVTLAGLEKQLGFGNGSIAKWDVAPPAVIKVVAVANYFKVSVDWLIGCGVLDLPAEAMGELNSYIEYLRTKYRGKEQV